jgi:ribosomal protein L24
VIDRLSADPESDLTELTTVSRGSVAAQWARNINQYRYDLVITKGRVAVRDASANQTKDDDLFKVTACIDSSKVNLVDKNGKSVVPADGPRRVAYDYTVEKDGQRWYVIKEKVTETC